MTEQKKIDEAETIEELVAIRGWESANLSSEERAELEVKLWPANISRFESAKAAFRLPSYG